MADSTPQIDISWVQCNRCMKKLIKHETLRYGLTNCGHIFCENCLKNATQPKCFVCQMPNPRSVVLDRHLRPELRSQFLAILPMSQTMRVAIKYRDHHDTVNSQRFKKGLAGIGLQFRNAKQKIEQLKAAVTHENHRVQESRSKNMKLKEYGRSLMQEKKNLEIQIQQKKRTSSAFHDVSFKPVTSPPVTRKNLIYETAHSGSEPKNLTNNFRPTNGFNLDTGISQTFQGPGPNFFNKSAFETPHMKNQNRKFNF